MTALVGGPVHRAANAALPGGGRHMSRFASTRLAPVVVRARSLFSLGALEVRRVLGRVEHWRGGP